MHFILCNDRWIDFVSVQGTYSIYRVLSILLDLFLERSSNCNYYGIVVVQVIVFITWEWFLLSPEMN